MVTPQRPLIGVLAVALALIPQHGPAQAGAVDDSFNPDQGYGQGASDQVFAVALQTDGKILIGGDFTNYNGTAIHPVARLNEDGLLDAGFYPGIASGPKARTIALQPDGRILVGGGNGSSEANIFRLETDGGLDNTFVPGSITGQYVHSVALQPDGKILIAGDFISYGGTLRKNIARLNADGSLDATFDPGVGPSSDVHSIALQPDGRIVIGGNFTSYNGTGRARIARLNADGGLDASFDPGTGLNNMLSSLALQANGRIVIGGNFTSCNGTARAHIARLNADGSLDASFDPGSGTDSNVTSVGLQPDGRVLIGGNFVSFDGTAREHSARLNTDGSLDTSFVPCADGYYVIRSHVVQPDGKILIGTFGGFLTCTSTTRDGIARLNADGSVDIGFNPFVGASYAVRCMSLQPDGKILLGGMFLSYNDTARAHIARVKADGRLDPSFDPGLGTDGTVHAVVLQSDGKILIGGSFSTCNGLPYGNIARLNADGSLDASFDPGLGADLEVDHITLQLDGRILIGGYFTTYDGVARARIARLNPDGTLDASFDPGTGADGTVWDIAVQPDDRILAVGSFHDYNGTARQYITRINADGSLDASFDPGSGGNAFILSVTLQPDGRILIGGDLQFYNGAARGHLARLNADGSLDTSFDLGTGADARIYSILLRPDGRIMIAGAFAEYNDTLRNGIARLHPDGSLDTSFDPGQGATIYCAALQPDNRILIGGAFPEYDGHFRHYVARVHGQAMTLVPEIGGRGPSIWPNPVSTTLHLSEPMDFAVVDARGCVVLTAERMQDVPVDGLTPGLYVLRIWDGPALRFLKE